MNVVLPLVITLVGVGPGHPVKADHIAPQIAAAEAAYREAGLVPTAHVLIEHCGQMNAFYRWDDSLLLCDELDGLRPNVIRFIAAHEYAHAVVREYGVPIGDGEAAADELASLVLLASNDRDAVVAGADFLLTTREPGKDDPHPPGLQRARMLLCLDDGSDAYSSVDPNCLLYYHRAISHWEALFADKENTYAE